MAAVAESADLLNCSLCSSPYDSTDHLPKLLSCHHSYCLSCLIELATDRNIVKCPECRKRTTITKGVAALKNNFYVAQMLKLMSPSTTEGDNNTCLKHLDQPLLFYCETCALPICMNCTVLDHDKSKGHVISDIAQVIDLHKQVLQAKYGKMRQTIKERERQLQSLRCEVSNLETAKTSSMQQVEEMFTQLQKKLLQRKGDLTEKIENIYAEKKEHVMSQGQKIRAMKDLLKEKAAAIEEIQNTGQTLASEAVDNLELMTAIDDLCQDIALDIPENSYIEFDYSRGLHNFGNSVQILGDITSNRQLPSKVNISFPKLISALGSAIEIHITSLSGEPLSHYPITVTIQDPKNDDLVTKIKYETDGLYVVRFCPQMPGQHKIWVRFQDAVIWGSETEFTVESNNPVAVFGQGSDGKDSDVLSLARPTSVAIAPGGKLCIADMGNHRIQLMDKDGTVVSTIKAGHSNATVYDIAVSHVTEEIMCTRVVKPEEGGMTASSVRVFSLTGDKKRQFTNKEMHLGMFLAVNSKCWIIVTDTTENCVYVYSKEGIPMKKFGTLGSKPGQFNFPTSVCVGQSDEIIIADTKNDRIQVFDQKGKFIHLFGKTGDKKGEFRRPRGIATDKKGQILVADSHNRIQVFQPDGSFLGCIDSLGDKIAEPYNMAVSDDGHVFVADFGNNCVKKYRYMYA